MAGVLVILAMARIILFDGVCNLCNRSVRFVLKRDWKSVFTFGSLQSRVAEKILNQYSIDPEKENSIVLIQNGKAYTKSSAVLRICTHLGALWPLMAGFLIVPKCIRDYVYNMISRNRYKWFGRSETCMIPSADIRHKFLNESENE